MRCIVVVAFLCAPAAVHAAPYEAPDCAVNALYVLLQLHGRHADLAGVEAALPARGGADRSMADVRDAAGSFGLRLDGRSLRGRGAAIDRPTIALVNKSGRGHFLVLRPIGETGTLLQVLDPPLAPRVIDRERLLASGAWTGRVLVAPTAGERATQILRFGLLLAIPTAIVALIARRARRRAVTAWS